MIEYLKNPIFKAVAEACQDDNCDAYAIGGYVRDCLLKRKSKDIDIVVIGSGIAIAKKTAGKLGIKNVSVFKNFGTAMFMYKGTEVEFVGARKESYQRDSRKPIVEDGTLEDDQNRRDFTINALAISLNKKNYGELVDPFNGVADLNKGIIRTPLEPDTTFSDDPLRMLRAIRFATQLDFKIQLDTFEAITRNANRIEIISKERIIDELNKIMKAPKPSIGLLLMEKCGLLKLILPELTKLKGVEQKEGKAHKDNFYHSIQVLDNLAQKSDNLWLRWAALLHDIGKERTKKYVEGHGWTFHAHDMIGARMVQNVFRRLKLPLDGRLKYVKKLVALHLRPIALTQETVTDSAIRRLLFDAGDEVDDLMTLCEADITSKFESTVKRHTNNFKLVRQKLKEIEEKDAIRNFQPPVSGDEIIQTFNLPPCKEIGIIKNAIKEAILEGEIHNNRKEAIEYMYKTAKEMGLKARR